MAERAKLFSRKKDYPFGIEPSNQSEEDKEYRIKWNQFGKYATGSFSELFCLEGLHDVTLCCGGETVKAHKVVLATGSYFFKKIFLETPAKHPVILIKDMTFKTLQKALHFMYFGEIEVEDEKEVVEFNKAAEYLELRHFKKIFNKLPQKKQEQSSVSSNSALIRPIPSTINDPIKTSPSSAAPKPNQIWNENGKPKQHHQQPSQLKEKRLNDAELRNRLHLSGFEFQPPPLYYPSLNRSCSLGSGSSSSTGYSAYSIDLESPEATPKIVKPSLSFSGCVTETATGTTVTKIKVDDKFEKPEVLRKYLLSSTSTSGMYKSPRTPRPNYLPNMFSPGEITSSTTKPEAFASPFTDFQVPKRFEWNERDLKFFHSNRQDIESPTSTNLNLKADIFKHFELPPKGASLPLSLLPSPSSAFQFQSPSLPSPHKNKQNGHGQREEEDPEHPLFWKKRGKYFPIV